MTKNEIFCNLCVDEILIRWKWKMVKRILKIFLIVFGCIIAFFAGAIGIYALAGGFKEKVVDITKLYFASDSDDSGESTDKSSSHADYTMDDFPMTISYEPSNATNKTLTVRVIEGEDAVTIPSTVTAGEKFVVKLNKDEDGNNIGGTVRIRFTGANQLVSCEQQLMIDTALTDDALRFESSKLVPYNSSDLNEPIKYLTASSTDPQVIQLTSLLNNSISISRESELDSSLSNYAGVKTLYPVETIDPNNMLSAPKMSANKKGYYYLFTPSVTGSEVKISVKMHRTFAIEQEYIAGNFDLLYNRADNYKNNQAGYNTKLIEFNNFLTKYIKYFSISDSANKFFNDNITNGVVNFLPENTQSVITTALNYVFATAKITITVSDVSLDSIEINDNKVEYKIGADDTIYSITATKNMLQEAFGIVINPNIEGKNPTESETAKNTIKSQLANVVLEAYAKYNEKLTVANCKNVLKNVQKLNKNTKLQIIDFPENVTIPYYATLMASGVKDGYILRQWEETNTHTDQQLLTGEVIKVTGQDGQTRYLQSVYYPLVDNNYLQASIVSGLNEGDYSYKLHAIAPVLDEKVKLVLRFSITMTSVDIKAKKTREVDLEKVEIKYDDLGGGTIRLDSLKENMVVNSDNIDIHNSANVSRREQKLSTYISNGNEIYYQTVKYFVVGSSNSVKTDGAGDIKLISANSDATNIVDINGDSLTIGKEAETDVHYYEICTTMKENGVDVPAIVALNASAVNSNDSIKVFACIVLTKDVNGEQVPIDRHGNAIALTDGYRANYVSLYQSSVFEFRTISLLQSVEFYSVAKNDGAYAITNAAEGVPFKKDEKISRNITDDTIEMKFKAVKLLVGFDELYKDLLKFQFTTSNDAQQTAVNTNWNNQQAFNYAVQQKILSFAIIPTQGTPDGFADIVKTSNNDYFDNTQETYSLQLKGVVAKSDDNPSQGILTVSTANDDNIPYTDINDAVQIEVYDTNISSVNMSGSGVTEYNPDAECNQDGTNTTITQLNAQMDGSNYLQWKNKDGQYFVKYNKSNGMPNGMSVATDLAKATKYEYKDENTNKSVCIEYKYNYNKVDIIYNTDGGDDFSNQLTLFTESALTSTTNASITAYLEKYIKYIDKDGKVQYYIVEYDANGAGYCEINNVKYSVIYSKVTIDGVEYDSYVKVGETFVGVVDNSKYVLPTETGKEPYYNSDTRQLNLRQESTDESNINYALPIKYSEKDGRIFAIRYRYQYNYVNCPTHYKDVIALYNMTCEDVKVVAKNGPTAVEANGNEALNLQGGKKSALINSTGSTEKPTGSETIEGGYNLLTETIAEGKDVSCRVLMGTNLVSQYCTYTLPENGMAYFLEWDGSKWKKCYSRKGADYNNTSTLHIYTEDVLKEDYPGTLRVSYTNSLGEQTEVSFNFLVKCNKYLKVADTYATNKNYIRLNSNTIDIYTDNLETETINLIAGYDKVKNNYTGLFYIVDEEGQSLSDIVKDENGQYVKDKNGQYVNVKNQLASIEIHKLILNRLDVSSSDVTKNEAAYISLSDGQIKLGNIANLYHDLEVVLQFTFDGGSYYGAENAPAWKLIIHPRQALTIEQTPNIYQYESVYNNIIKLSKYSNDTVRGTADDYAKIKVGIDLELTGSKKSIGNNQYSTETIDWKADDKKYGLTDSEIKAIVDNYEAITGSSITEIDGYNVVNQKTITAQIKLGAFATSDTWGYNAQILKLTGTKMSLGGDKYSTENINWTADKDYGLEQDKINEIIKNYKEITGKYITEIPNYYAVGEQKIVAEIKLEAFAKLTAWADMVDVLNRKPEYTFVPDGKIRLNQTLPQDLVLPITIKYQNASDKLAGATTDLQTEAVYVKVNIPGIDVNQTNVNMQRSGITSVDAKNSYVDINGETLSLRANRTYDFRDIFPVTFGVDNYNLQNHLYYELTDSTGDLVTARVVGDTIPSTKVYWTKTGDGSGDINKKLLANEIVDYLGNSDRTEDLYIDNKLQVTDITREITYTLKIYFTRLIDTKQHIVYTGISKTINFVPDCHYEISAGATWTKLTSNNEIADVIKEKGTSDPLLKANTSYKYSFIPCDENGNLIAFRYDEASKQYVLNTDAYSEMDGTDNDGNAIKYYKPTDAGLEVYSSSQITADDSRPLYNHIRANVGKDTFYYVKAICYELTNGYAENNEYSVTLKILVIAK